MNDSYQTITFSEAQSTPCSRRVANSDLATLDDDELWDTVLSVNVRGAFRCARAAAPHLRATHGAIVNIGSIAGVNGEGYS